MPVCEVPNTYKTCKEAANYLVNEKCGEGLQVLKDKTAADFHKIHPKCESLDAGDVRLWPFLYHIFGKPIVLECPEIECPKKEEPAQNIPQSQPVAENGNGGANGGIKPQEEKPTQAQPVASNGTKITDATRGRMQNIITQADGKIKELRDIGAGDEAKTITALLNELKRADTDKKAKTAIGKLKNKLDELSGSE